MQRYRAERVPNPDNRIVSYGPDNRKKRTNAEEEKRDEKPARETSRSEDEPSGEYRRFVTNEDEQSKITNTADGSPLDEREQEGI